MPDLQDLYQQIILDHNRNPRNFREMPDATAKVDGYNPLCGDHYTVYLKLDGDLIREISFTGRLVTGFSAAQTPAELWYLSNETWPVTPT